ncbi:uncharacterized protein LOC132742814 [Ruditapes philippinarum]|uniref:uncharacterized protein LOC132742814 n=1 Tax=Ruditapes philippinarum TaxID=129788 RepID=UPI00295BDDDB|nr:uncharacterized protein LOC132742814 [Ruditapes philippinarum]XP_060587287.1 uncharacterized protein LOC132742814 [Ruditapes philippinarum]
MASEETSEMLESSKPQLDLRFVDHVESKIQSPEREVISPTKKSIKGPFSASATSLIGKINENGTMDNVNENAKSDSKKEEQSETKSNDSGLDSSNVSSENSEEHFIDRQESYTAVDEPEVLTSPNRTVDKLFNFLDSSSSQSLDALNNNSEVIIGDNEEDKIEVAQTDMYLGKEVALHGGENGKDENVEQKETDDASMNLYWYTSSLDVDMAELEQFKTSQTEESKTTETITTNLQITVGNGYYKTKNIEVDLEPQNGSVYKSETSFDIKATPVKRDSWSPAFESASSRILDLASELKSEPKHKKNKENESIRSAVEVDLEKHPWGLDVDRKVMSEVETEGPDDLPDIGEISSRDNVDSSVGPYQSEASVAFMENEFLRNTESLEDEADAIGYMELADKPIVEVTSKSVKSQKGKRLDQEDKVKTVGAKEEHKQKIEVCAEDVADAIGYMEWKDKPVDESIKVSEQTVLEYVDHRSTERTVGEVRTETASVTSIESQILGKGAMVEASQKSKSEGIDSPDAGLEVIEKSDNKTVQSSLQESLKEPEKVEAKPFDPFNIKRKYIVGRDSEGTVKKMGGKLIGTEKMVDEYLDDSNYSLLLNDCWLRLRNKKFEMKVNAAFGYGPNISPAVEMLTNESDIQEMLMKKFEKTLEQKRRVSERQLDVLIDALGFSEFVTFETIRKKFQVDGFTVTMETTNFGFQVGEVDIVANSLPEMMTSLKNMDDLAAKLGFRPLQSN